VVAPVHAGPPSAALAGDGEILLSDLPPDWDEENPEAHSGDDFPDEDLQAEVAIGWGFSVGLDAAFDD
jgi:hypothetical protein